MSERIDKIEFGSCSREYDRTVTDILIIFISDDVIPYITIFISKSSRITISIPIVVSKLNLVFSIALEFSWIALVWRCSITFRIVCCHASACSYTSSGWACNITTSTEIIEVSIIWCSSNISTTSIIPKASCFCIMSSPCSSTDNLSIPVFLIVDDTAILDCACEIFWEEIKLFEKCDTIHGPCAGNSNIPHRFENTRHECGEYDHWYHELKEGKPSMIKFLYHFHEYF